MTLLTAEQYVQLFKNYCNLVHEGKAERIDYPTYKILNSISSMLESSQEGVCKIEFSQEVETLNIIKHKIRIYIPDFAFWTFPISEDLYNHIKKELDEVSSEIKNEKKENKNMANSYYLNEGKTPANTNNLIPAFDFGPVASDQIQISPYGIAVKNKDHRWISYNAATNSIVDVSGFTFDLKKILFKMPVALNQVRVGDTIIHDHWPVYVTTVGSDGKQISAIDIRDMEIKTVLPATNMFGFNFVTKVVNLINFQSSVPDSNNPFGNIMPYLFMSSMFSNKDGEGNDMFDGDLSILMMYNMVCGNQSLFGNLFNGLFPQSAVEDKETK